MAGDPSKAIDDFSRLIAAKPDATDLYMRRADLYMKVEKWDAAVADYEKVLSADPENALALAGKGMAIARKGDRRTGAEQLQKALKMTNDPKKQEDIREKLRELGVGPLL